MGAFSKTYAPGATSAAKAKAEPLDLWPAELMHRSTPMMDLLMAAIALALFAAAIGYTYACERL